MRRSFLAIILLLLAAASAAAQSIQPQVSWRGLRMPSGQLQINWANPITQGLSLVISGAASNSGQGALFSARGQAPLGLANGGWFSPIASGMALTSDTASAGAGLYSHNATTYTMPTGAGSVFAFVRAAWSPGDGGEHVILEINTNGAAPEFSFLKYLDNNWYFGWNGASNTRASTAASGTFVAGDSFVAGGTWTSAGTNFYVKGALVATSALAPSSFTSSGLDFCAGCLWNGGTVGAPWSSASMVDGVHYVAVWDRALNANEIQALSQNPSQIFMAQRDNEFSTLVGIAASVSGTQQFFRGPF